MRLIEKKTFERKFLAGLIIRVNHLWSKVYRVNVLSHCVCVPQITWSLPTL